MEDNFKPPSNRCLGDVPKRDKWTYEFKQKWTYKCKAGVYTESSLLKLLYVIYSHRMEHLIRDGQWMD
tara:strand:- start:199 stop:402 length:204 start_codon:yes stop_codon:yes gene_type:complete